MSSLTGRRNSPGRGDKGGTQNVTDITFEEVASGMDQGLTPDMSRHFDAKTLEHIEHNLLPAFIRDNDVDKVEACEVVLAKYGRACPNGVSGFWAPLSVPRNEMQVRELLAAHLPDYGYQLVCSQAEFPDWLLVSKSGDYVYAEVEHRSSSFWRHSHNPADCDLIVCWEHDWPESPLPVLEMLSESVISPTAPTPGRRDRNSLSINFSGALAPHYKKRDQTPLKMMGEFKLDYVAERYEQLASTGVSDARATRIIAQDFGISAGRACSLLVESGARKKVGLRPSKTDATVSRYEDLVAGGLTSGEAKVKTAEEFGITRQSVEAYRSRVKKKKS